MENREAHITIAVDYLSQQALSVHMDKEVAEEHGYRVGGTIDINGLPHELIDSLEQSDGSVTFYLRECDVLLSDSSVKIV